MVHAYSEEGARNPQTRVVRDDHVSVNVEIWSVREEVLRASACLSSEGQGRGSPEYGDRAGERTGPIHEARTRVA